MRIYVMLSLAMEQERLLLAERVLTEIERRHGLPHDSRSNLNSAFVDRFLAAYLPECRDGLPVPNALEYTFTPTLSEALDIMRRVVTESPDGYGSALYVHDLDVVEAGQ